MEAKEIETSLVRMIAVAEDESGVLVDEDGSRGRVDWEGDVFEILSLFILHQLIKNIRIINPLIPCININLLLQWTKIQTSPSRIRIPILAIVILNSNLW